MDRQALQAKAKGLQIVAAALIAGLVVITGALVFLRSRQGGAPNPLAADLGFPLWSIPMALLPVALVLSGVVSSAVVSGGVRSLIQKRRNGPSTPTAGGASVDTDVMGIVAGRFMLRTALVEGVGMIGSAMYFLEGNDLALIAPAAAVLWMALMFPTTDRILSEYEIVESRVTAELES
jgi:hypothetical protein